QQFLKLLKNISLTEETLISEEDVLNVLRKLYIENKLVISYELIDAIIETRMQSLTIFLDSLVNVLNESQLNHLKYTRMINSLNDNKLFFSIKYVFVNEGSQEIQILPRGNIT
ncbi:MAG TPA: hypothetical protein PLD88_07240, partial [Candidatus Berkiella sp.]|nr:hypothetical protein [Candidatus Berkiella sp.]